MGIGVVVMDTKIVRTGRVAAYFDKGYGFIYEDANDKKLCSWFFHVKSCTCEPVVGLQVQFRITAGPKGLMAIDVDLLDLHTGLDALSGKTSSQEGAL
jgi:cold shock CspA family protein